MRTFFGIDVLISNSKFLESKVVNGTPTDDKMRYGVSVGVAHGSPTREVHLNTAKPRRIRMASPETVRVEEPQPGPDM